MSQSHSALAFTPEVVELPSAKLHRLSHGDAEGEDEANGWRFVEFSRPSTAGSDRSEDRATVTFASCNNPDAKAYLTVPDSFLSNLLAVEDVLNRRFAISVTVISS